MTGCAQSSMSWRPTSCWSSCMAISAARCGTRAGSSWPMTCASRHFGRGQALRGVKHHDARPDFCFVDDVEEEEHIRSPEARQETLRWFMTELVAALDKHARLPVTPLDREALPMVLSRQPGWIAKIYPIEYFDPQGVRRATWPSRFPLKWVNEKREEFQSLGLQAEFSQEYLCVPEDPTRKVFSPS